jgi:hypothetical protein
LWDKFVLCASKNSLTSRCVGNKIKTTLEKESALRKERGTSVQKLIPLNLDGYFYRGGLAPDWTLVKWSILNGTFPSLNRGAVYAAFYFALVSKSEMTLQAREEWRNPADAGQCARLFAGARVRKVHCRYSAEGLGLF